MADVTGFEVSRDCIYKTVNESLARRGELLTEGKITKDEYIKIGKEEEKLRRQASDLTIKIAEGTIESFTAHLGKITIVTGKLETTIKDINGFNESINFLSKVITFFGNILSLPSLGLAGIPQLLDDFQGLL